MNVDVRIRHADDTKAQPFTSWPIAELDGLITTIKQWGIETEYGSHTGADLYGQFVISPSASFFEIVIGES